jgi:putative transposase
MARVVAAGMPHLVTQRGNRGLPVFFGDSDYELYKELLAEGCRSAHVALWAYCLMPGQVHLLMVPKDEEGLRAALSDTHRRYTLTVNARKKWHGFLWQGRFASFAMDKPHLLAAARYVELAPLRAKMARRARDWRWSSARAHLKGRDDGLVRVKPLLERAGDWAALLGEGLSEEEYETIGKAERTGRPLGSPSFVKRLEEKLGRTLAKRKPGPKPKKKKTKKK